MASFGGAIKYANVQHKEGFDEINKLYVCFKANA
jgi:hypothetical protein